MTKSNPTQKTQKEILDVIKKSKLPMSITAIADASGKGLYAVQETIKYLQGFGVVRTLITSGNTTIVQLNKPGIMENARVTN